jgi:hypothetical protein
MNRRLFLSALPLVVLAPAVPRRAYSFLWSNPIARPRWENIEISWNGIAFPGTITEIAYSDTLAERCRSYLVRHLDAGVRVSTVYTADVKMRLPS